MNKKMADRSRTPHWRFERERTRPREFRADLYDRRNRRQMEDLRREFYHRYQEKDESPYEFYMRKLQILTSLKDDVSDRKLSEHELIDVVWPLFNADVQHKLENEYLDDRFSLIAPLYRYHREKQRQGNARMHLKVQCGPNNCATKGEEEPKQIIIPDYLIKQDNTFEEKRKKFLESLQPREIHWWIEWPFKNFPEVTSMTDEDADVCCIFEEEMPEEPVNEEVNVISATEVCDKGVMIQNTEFSSENVICAEQVKDTSAKSKSSEARTHKLFDESAELTHQVTHPDIEMSTSPRAFNAQENSPASERETVVYMEMSSPPNEVPTREYSVSLIHQVDDESAATLPVMCTTRTVKLTKFSKGVGPRNQRQQRKPKERFQNQQKRPFKKRISQQLLLESSGAQPHLSIFDIGFENQPNLWTGYYLRLRPIKTTSPPGRPPGHSSLRNFLNADYWTRPPMQ